MTSFRLCVASMAMVALATISILCIVLAVPCRILLVPIYGNPMAAHFLLPAKMDVLFSGVLIPLIL